jgi:hypothetical protein
MLDNIQEYISDNQDKFHVNNSQIFIYITIFIIILGYVSRFNISLAIILGFVLGYYVFNKLVYSTQNHEKKKIDMLDNKIKDIRPSPGIISKYHDIVNFLFSIQDLYVYNPPSYEEMVESIKSFFVVYEESIKIPKLSHQNYSIAELKFNNAVNSLHTIILNSESDDDLNNKINRAYRVLYKLLKKYLDEIELNIQKDIKYNGYNNRTVVLDTKLKPYNYSESSKFTFDMIF